MTSSLARIYLAALALVGGVALSLFAKNDVMAGVLIAPALALIAREGHVLTREKEDAVEGQKKAETALFEATQTNLRRDPQQPT